MSHHPRSLKIAVLGAGGLIGSGLVRSLAQAGHQIIASGSHLEGLHCQLTQLRLLRAVQLVSGDLMEPRCAKAAMEGAQVVVHCASRSNPTSNLDQPQLELHQVTEMVAHLFRHAQRAGAEHFVFPSSGGSLYADLPRPRTETDPVAPRCPYAIAKLAAEQMIDYLGKRHGMRTTLFRIGNPFGIGQGGRRGQGVLAHWHDALCNRRAIEIYGDGTAERDYLAIDDACRLMSAVALPDFPGGIFNVGSGQATSLNGLLELVAQHWPGPLQKRWLAGRTWDIHSIALDPGKLLGYHPGFCFQPLSESIRAQCASAAGRLDASVEAA